MPFTRYVSKRFRSGSLDRIRQVNTIINEYVAQGYKLTLRQAYYQLVSRALIPNTQRSYKQLGDVVNDGRLAGLIDWDAIEDRTREMRRNSFWDSPSDIVRSCAQQFRVDTWSDQNHYCECWIEKEALAGVIERVCRELDVPYFSCRGYVSQSEMWAAAQRLTRARAPNSERLSAACVSCCSRGERTRRQEKMPRAATSRNGATATAALPHK